MARRSTDQRAKELPLPEEPTLIVEAELAPPPGAAPPEPRGLGRQIVRRGSPFALLIVLAAILLAFSIDLPSTYATHGNFVDMVNSQAVLLILCLAVLFPLRAGDFDLSVSASAVLVACLTAVLTAQHGYGPVETIILGLLLGTAVGAANALFVVVIGLDSFISTLGVMTAVGGIGYAVTGSQVVTGISSPIITMSEKVVFGLPLATWYGWILALIILYIFQRTAFGRYLLFVGGNREAARLSGVKVQKYRILAFLISGLLSGFAGVVLAGNLGSIDPSIGPQYLLQPYAAAFLGLTAIVRNRFNVLGTVVALYLLVAGSTGLNLLGAQSWVSDLFNGGALVVALTISSLSNKAR
jgi:ribose transport system permease protein